jgi:hypothetical protein
MYRELWLLTSQQKTDSLMYRLEGPADTCLNIVPCFKNDLGTAMRQHKEKTMAQRDTLHYAKAFDFFNRLMGWIKEASGSVDDIRFAISAKGREAEMLKKAALLLTGQADIKMRPASEIAMKANNPSVRIKAVKQLPSPEHDELLKIIATSDLNADVRCTAITQIQTEQILYEIILNGLAWGGKDVANSDIIDRIQTPNLLQQLALNQDLDLRTRHSAFCTLFAQKKYDIIGAVLSQLNIENPQDENLFCAIYRIAHDKVTLTADIEAKADQLRPQLSGY